MILQFFYSRFYIVSRTDGDESETQESGPMWMWLIASLGAFGALVALLRWSLMTLDRWRSRRRPVALVIPLDRSFE